MVLYLVTKKEKLLFEPSQFKKQNSAKQKKYICAFLVEKIAN